MNNKILLFLVSVTFVSCSSKDQLIYFNDYDRYSQKNVEHSTVLKFENSYNIEARDMLKIDVYSVVPEAALSYNKTSQHNAQSSDKIKLESFLVDDSMQITYPVLGVIGVENLSLKKLEKKITNLLVSGGHLKNPTVKISRVNFKFTVIGEVRSPGTFSFIDENINIFQALGYAGDLTINGKRKNITLLRDNKGTQKIYDINLTKSDIINKPYFYIKNNDVIIIEPNFSKVKSAGFIGSPASIASISSLLLSVTLLLINN